MRLNSIPGIARRLAFVGWLLVVVAIGVDWAGAAATDPQLRAVRFVVSAPEAAPAAEIYCSFSIDQWPAGGRALPRVASGLFAATFDLPVGRALEYKFIRERDWKAVEKDAAGGEVGNRVLTPAAEGREEVIFHAVARWADRPEQLGSAATLSSTGGSHPPASRPTQATRTGDVRVHRDFESPQLKNRRTLWVYLPPGYDSDAAMRYPVLYVHDGQNVFDAATSFQGVEWGLDETAERLIGAGRLPPLIIVAIENTRDRISEYTCVADPVRGGGNGEAYLDFLVKTVKPFIDATYRTRPEREQTAVLGSSLGGLISLYSVIKYPDVFGACGVVSPALFWADNAAIEAVRAAEWRRMPRLWLDIGTAEGNDLPAFERARGACDRLADALRERGLREGEGLAYEVVEGGRHHERDWAVRADRVLMHLFPKP